MTACPSCGRALATGARTCVYCSQGNAHKRRDELKIPAGTLPKRKRGLPWGRLLLALAVLAAVGAYFQPDIHRKVDGFVRSILSKF